MATVSYMAAVAQPQELDSNQRPLGLQPSARPSELPCVDALTGLDPVYTVLQTASTNLTTARYVPEEGFEPPHY
jgi:hypothetical protein